ncbi:Steroid 5 alpha-reductase 3, partial [Linnemannia gamsii]
TVIRSVPAVLTSSRHYWSLLTLLNHLGIMPAHIPLASAQSAITNEPFIVRSWTPPPHILLTMACYLFQVVRRWYESWFVERPSVEAKMNVSHYIIGITFYSAMAPSTWIDAYEAWIKQGAATGPAESITTSSALPLDSMLLGLNGQCLLGLMIFIWASWHQYNCHVILANLRPKPVKAEDKPKKQDYKVPFGDWFQYMVAPHYSAEMLIYISLYLMASSSPLTANSSTAPTLLFACVWVVVNLGIVARETDQWYRTRFGDRYAATVMSPDEDISMHQHQFSLPASFLHSRPDTPSGPPRSTLNFHPSVGFTTAHHAAQFVSASALHALLTLPANRMTFDGTGTHQDARIWLAHIRLQAKLDHLDEAIWCNRIEGTKDGADDDDIITMLQLYIYATEQL